MGNDVETPLQANWFSARELNHLVRYLDDLYTNTRPVRGEVGIFVSGLTDMMRSLTAHQVLQTEDALNMGGLCQMLRDLNIAYEAIGEDQLPKLGSFKAILLGQFSMCADPATVDAFRKYVRDGGMLIVTNYAFSADANGAEIANPAFDLADMWGAPGRSTTKQGKAGCSIRVSGQSASAVHRRPAPSDAWRCGPRVTGVGRSCRPVSGWDSRHHP